MQPCNSPADERALWVALGSVDQIGRGQGRCVSVGRRRLALFRTRSGGLYALDAYCPHRNGPLADGIAGADAVICPLHGYKFSLIDGRGLDNPLRVKRYRTEINDGLIYVRLEADGEAGTPP